ncbi:DUF6245 family protein [Thermomonospora umbrina]|uniref:DUF6245 family protein n=1 Tax=Thermomonospora umbrina TaxID=111806 RepID=UPI003CCC8B9D
MTFLRRQTPRAAEPLRRAAGDPSTGPVVLAAMQTAQALQQMLGAMAARAGHDGRPDPAGPPGTPRRTRRRPRGTRRRDHQPRRAGEPAGAVGDLFNQN